MADATDSDRPDPAARTLTRLARFQGSWHGRGVGDYPTIERFEYEEDLHFFFEAEYGFVRYEQKTRLTNGEPSHWEFGFLRCMEDGSVEVSNVQESGRVEALAGALRVDGERLVLELESLVLGNDRRLIGTRRSLVLHGDRLDTRSYMSTHTTETPTMLLHLTASLERREPSAGPHPTEARRG